MTTSHNVTVVQTNNSWHVVPGILRIEPGDEVTFATPGPELRISMQHPRLRGERGLIKVTKDDPAVLEIPEIDYDIYPYVVIVHSECGLAYGEGSALPVFIFDY